MRTLVDSIDVSQYKGIIETVVTEALHRCVCEPLNRQIEVADEVLKALKKHCPALGVILHFAWRPNGLSAVWVTGLPVFPIENRKAANKLLSLALGRVLGLPFQYLQQKPGDIVSALEPRHGAVENSNSSSAHFGAHTDDAFFLPQYRCRHITLLGEKNDSHTETGFAPIEDILDWVEKNGKSEYVDLLQQDMFSFRRPHSFAGDGPSWSPPRPIVYTTAWDEIAVQAPTYNCKVLQPRANEAFEVFKLATDHCMRWFSIDPGCWLAFRNDRGLHSRKAIVGSDQSGISRRVWRTYFRPDLDALRKVTGSEHVFDIRNFC